jgi:hypothetical protein
MFPSDLLFLAPHSFLGDPLLPLTFLLDSAPRLLFHLRGVGARARLRYIVLEYRHNGNRISCLQNTSLSLG